MDSRLQLGKCICGNDDDDRFWVLQSPDEYEDFWGICCKRRSCQTEYLISDICQDETDDKNPHRVSWDGVQLFKKKPLKPRNNYGFQANLQRVRVKKIQQLKKGDQITWSRRYFIWHHGVVTKVNENNFEIVHWSNVTKVKMKIIKVLLTEIDLKRAFKIDYYDVFGHDDGRDLVVSRAYSRLHLDDEKQSFLKLVKMIGAYDHDYALLNANCEHFATYCTHGSGVCYQNRYAAHVTTDTLNANSAKAGAIMASEAIENLAHASEMVGASAVVCFESVNFLVDYRKLRNLFKGGLISRKVFIHEIIKHLTGSVLGVISGVVGGTLVTSIPLLEIVLAPLFALVGKFAGMQLGSEIGLAITDKCIDRNEKVVPNIDDLNPGDHIVRTRFGGILRTHGIFVKSSSREGFIDVILFKKKRIVKLEIKFSGIRRVMYTEDEELASPEDVISAAESLVADPAPRVNSRKRQVSSCKLQS